MIVLNPTGQKTHAIFSQVCTPRVPQPNQLFSPPKPLLGTTNHLDPILLITQMRRQLPKLPFRECDASLLINRAHQRRQHLIRIADRSRRITATAIIGTASIRPRIPHRNLGLHASDGIRVRARKLAVDALLDHHVLDQALRAAKGLCHLGIGVGHARETLCLFELADQQTLGFLGLADEERFGLLGGGDEGCFSGDSGLVGLGVSGLLLADDGSVGFTGGGGEGGFSVDFGLVCVRICYF